MTIAKQEGFEILKPLEYREDVLLRLRGLRNRSLEWRTRRFAGGAGGRRLSRRLNRA